MDIGIIEKRNSNIPRLELHIEKHCINIKIIHILIKKKARYLHRRIMEILYFLTLVTEPEIMRTLAQGTQY